MRRVLLAGIVLCGLVFAVSSGTFATQVSLSPNPSDLYDLDHTQYYTWGINWQVPQGQHITEGVLTFHNIYDWTVEDCDIIWIHLLPSATAGVAAGTDSENRSDAFLNQGTLVGTWTDIYGGSPRSPQFDLVFTFSQLNLLPTLTNYASDGNFGFGIDPDCHYYNDGIDFTITTEPNPLIPEPLTILGLSLGIGAVATYVRRRLMA
jgi:hypothetical protein